MTKPEMDDRLQEIINRISKAGGRAYLVGGAVRDSLLSRNPQDYDFYIEGLSSEIFSSLFPAAELVGKNFQVFRLEGSDFIVYPKKDQVSLEQELGRRDFTINAMALDLSSGEIIDPFLGRKDLAKGFLRALPGALADDPLRIYRGARLAAELSNGDKFFHLLPETKQEIKNIRDGLIPVVPERVFGEFRKVINADRPTLFFKILKEIDLLDVHFPEIAALIGVKQPEQYHPEGDVFTHALLSLEIAAEEGYPELVRFGALVHDLGKGLTPVEEQPHHYGHEGRGVQPLKAFCRRLKMPGKWMQAGRLAVEEHSRGLKWREMKPGKIVRLLEKAVKNPLGVKGLQQIIICDQRGRGNRAVEVKVIKGMEEAAEGMFAATSGLKFEHIPEGPAYGQAVFQYRCSWVKQYIKLS